MENKSLRVKTVAQELASVARHIKVEENRRVEGLNEQC